MSKRTRARGAQVRPEPRATVPAADAAEVVLQRGVRVSWIAIRSLSYRETGKAPIAPANMETEQTMSASWEFESGLSLIARLAASVTIRFSFTADVKPVEVKGEIQGLFTRDESVSPIAFIQYLNNRGGTMLVPYIREAISSVTSRGMFGPIFVEPMAFASIAPPDALAELLAAYTGAIKEEDEANSLVR